jgi:hypothetical protein
LTRHLFANGGDELSSHALAGNQQKKEQHKRGIWREKGKTLITGDEGQGNEDDRFHEGAILTLSRANDHVKRWNSKRAAVRISRL